MRIILGVALILAANTAMAEHPWSVFFDAPDAQVETDMQSNGKPAETVMLPGKVRLMRQKDGDEWSYVGVDMSEAGAVGCIARIFGEVYRVAENCPSEFSEAQNKQLTETLGRLADFYAANALPEITRMEFFLELPTEPLQCKDVAADFYEFRDRLLDPDMTPIIDELLAEPRLPVTNPCL